MLADSVAWSWLSKASHSDGSSVTFDTIRFCSASGRAIAAVSGKALAAGGSCPFYPRLAPCGSRVLREQVRDGGGEELGAGGLGGLELALQGVAQRQQFGHLRHDPHLLRQRRDGDRVCLHR